MTVVNVDDNQVAFDMTTITVVMQERYTDNVLIYTVKVRNPDDYEEVKYAVEEEHLDHVGLIGNQCDPLFCFQGDICMRADWRDYD
jgi:hypothetical protein